MKPKLEELLLQRLDLGQALVSRSLNDPDFQGFLFPLINRDIHEALRSRRP